MNCPVCRSSATCYTTRDNHYRCRECGILWTITRNVGDISPQALEAGAAEEVIRVHEPSEEP